MKVLLTTFGTRGDIQPFIALAQGLQAAGYDAALCTAQGFQADVEAHAVPYIAMDNELLELSERVLDNSRGIGDTIAAIRKMGPAVRQMMNDEWQAARTFQPDLIIYHSKCFGSYHVAEKLDIPSVMALPLPFYTPTKDFALPFVAANLPGWVNRSTYNFLKVPNLMYTNMVNYFRTRTLRLSPIGRFADWLVRADGEPTPVLYPISRHVLPEPEDYPDHAHFTGYWFLDHRLDWQADPALVEFLGAGPAPVYIGFGSVSARNAKRRLHHVLNAVRVAGQRVVLASGWSKLDTSDLPDTVFSMQSVPHDWLFPQVAAVVHHGGAGTTAAGLRAGKPSIICPFMADQPFWGKRVHELGVGPKPIPQSKITADRLAEAIHAVVHDKTMQGRAAALGEKIRSESGVACAVEIISQMRKSIHTQFHSIGTHIESSST